MQQLSVRSVSILVLAVALNILGATAALAQGKPSSKIYPALARLHGEYAAHLADHASIPFASPSGLVRVAGDSVLVDAVTSGDGRLLEPVLAALGMRDTSVFGRVVSGWLPISAIPALEGIAILRSAQPSSFIAHVGAITSQGDAALRSDITRNTLGVSGAGVKVGVLSDSFNCRGGAAADIASGDLPAVEVIDESPACGGSADE